MNYHHHNQKDFEKFFWNEYLYQKYLSSLAKTIDQIHCHLVLNEAEMNQQMEVFLVNQGLVTICQRLEETIFGHKSYESWVHGWNCNTIIKDNILWSKNFQNAYWFWNEYLLSSWTFQCKSSVSGFSKDLEEHWFQQQLLWNPMIQNWSIQASFDHHSSPKVHLWSAVKILQNHSSVPCRVAQIARLFWLKPRQIYRWRCKIHIISELILSFF